MTIFAEIDQKFFSIKFNQNTHIYKLKQRKLFFSKSKGNIQHLEFYTFLSLFLPTYYSLKSWIEEVIFLLTLKFL